MTPSLLPRELVGIVSVVIVDFWRYPKICNRGLSKKADVLTDQILSIEIAYFSYSKSPFEIACCRHPNAFTIVV